ncbi:MAG: flagellar hook-associated protein FlgK [Oscillospiraceae bacterium]|nr:flagellar hook-associated protein FlgK [Oscillospiraceae bacterium]
MRSTFLGFEVSKRTIQISQKALDITNNNLSNLNTEGYTRQRVDLNSSYINVTGKYATKLSRLSLNGQGVNAFGVSQIRDPYIDKRYREFTAYVAECDVKIEVLEDAERILDDIGNLGLLSNLDSLKAAFAKYATDSPFSKELASVVRNEASSVCQTLRAYYTDLENLKNENVIELKNSVKEVNELIDKIVMYNGIITGEYNVTAADKIYYGESVIGSYGPNELIDQRNQFIDELSYFGNIKVYDNDDGSVRIEMAGTTIVDGTKYEQVVMKDFDKYKAAVLVFSNGDAVDCASGDLKARMDMLNGNGSYASFYQNSEYGIPYYESTLNAFAQEFAELMNTLNGCTADDTSRAMFGTDEDEYDDNGVCINRGIITAQNIRISDEWMANATMIGENYNEETGLWELTLDGTNVNKLYLGLDNEITIGRAGEFKGSIYDYCLFVDNRLSESISYYKDQYDLNGQNASALLDLRASVSGVSETEEGVNMMNYQKWFNANSRMLTTLDECIDRLISSTGVAGR